MGKLTPHTKKFSGQPWEDAIAFSYHSTVRGKGFIVWDGTISGYVSNGKVRRIDSLDCYPNMVQPIGSVGHKLCYISQNRDIV